MLNRSFSLAIGTAVAQLIAIISIPVLSRLNSPEIYGEFAIIFMYAVTLSSFLNLKFELAIPVVDNNDESKKLFNTSILLNLVFSLSILFLTTILYFFISFNFWKWIIPIFTGSLLALIQAFYFHFVRKNSFKLLGILKALQAIFIALFSIIFSLFFNENYLGLLLGLFIGLLITVYIYRKKSEIILSQISYYLNFELIKKFKKFPIFLTPTNMFDVGKDFVFLYFSSIVWSPEITGLYFIALKLIIAPTSLIAGAISHVFLRDMSISFNQRISLIPQLKKLIYSTSLIGLIPLTIIILFGDSLLITFLGGEWSGISTFLLPLSFYSFIILIMTSLSMIPLILNRQGTAAIFNIFYCLIYLSPLLFSSFFGKELHESLWYMVILMAIYFLVSLQWIIRISTFYKRSI